MTRLLGRPRLSWLPRRLLAGSVLARSHVPEQTVHCRFLARRLLQHQACGKRLAVLPRLVLAAQSSAHLVRRRPGLGVGPSELRLSLLQGAPHDGVAFDQTLASGSQLLDLHRRHPPPAGQILEDPVPGRVGPFDSERPLLLGLDPDAVGAHPGPVQDLSRLGVGRGYEAGGVLLRRRRFPGHDVTRLLQHLLRPLPRGGLDLLGLRGRFGPEIGGGSTGGAQDGRRLLAHGRHESVLVEDRRPGGAFLRRVPRRLQLLRPLPRGAQVCGHPVKKRTDLGLIETPETGGENLGLNLLRRQRRVRSHRAQSLEPEVLRLGDAERPT